MLFMENSSKWFNIFHYTDFSLNFQRFNNVSLTVLMFFCGGISKPSIGTFIVL